MLLYLGLVSGFKSHVFQLSPSVDRNKYLPRQHKKHHKLKHLQKFILSVGWIYYYYYRLDLAFQSYAGFLPDANEAII